MKLLLDTCTFLWLLEGGAALGDRARELLLAPDGEVFLSAVSIWEIAVKQGLGRLTLPEPAERYLPAQRSERGILELPLTEDHVLQLPRLPALHRDPFDRMLVCQALADGMTLVTPDEEIAKYPVRVAW